MEIAQLAGEFAEISGYATVMFAITLVVRHPLPLFDPTHVSYWVPRHAVGAMLPDQVRPRATMGGTCPPHTTTVIKCPTVVAFRLLFAVNHAMLDA